MVEALPFDLRALQIFLAVCDAGSMSGAARQMGLTQPAISQAIAELEARTEAALLDRQVRPLALTASGILLRQRASALLAEARQIAPLVRQTHDGRLGLIRIGLVDSLSRAVGAALAGHAAAVADQAMFLSGLTESHAAALLTRQLDVFLGADELPDLDGVERWPICDEPYILLCPATYAPPSGDYALARLAESGKLVRFTGRSRTGIEIERHLHRLRLEIPRFLEFDTPFGVTEAVGSGLGWAISTPLCLFESGLAAGRVSTYRLPKPGLSRHLTLIARTRELGRTPRLLAEIGAKALLETVRPALRRVEPWLGESIRVATLKS